MYLLYLDEFGHPGPYIPSDPRHQQHPLFGFAGFVVDGRRWRDFDREFLRLKTRFYKEEVERAQTLEGLRPERYEPKRLRSRRDIRFTSHIMGLVGKCGGCVFAYGCVKHGAHPAEHNYQGLYMSRVQGALRRFEKYLANAPRRDLGVVIMDRRTEAQNKRVLESAQSHLFSAPEFRKPDVRITETPLLVPSEWYHGVQAADVIGRAVGRIYWHRKLNNPRFKKYDHQLGPVLSAHTHSIGGWHSIYVSS